MADIYVVTKKSELDTVADAVRSITRNQDPLGLNEFSGQMTRTFEEHLEPATFDELMTALIEGDCVPALLYDGKPLCIGDSILMI